MSKATIDFRAMVRPLVGPTPARAPDRVREILASAVRTAVEEVRGAQAVVSCPYFAIAAQCLIYTLWPESNPVMVGGSAEASTGDRDEIGPLGVGWNVDAARAEGRDPQFFLARPETAEFHAWVEVPSRMGKHHSTIIDLAAFMFEDVAKQRGIGWKRPPLPLAWGEQAELDRAGLRYRADRVMTEILDVQMQLSPDSGEDVASRAVGLMLDRLAEAEDELSVTMPTSAVVVSAKPPSREQQRRLRQLARASTKKTGTGG